MRSITSRKIYSMDYYSKHKDVLRKSIVVIEVDFESKESIQEEYDTFVDAIESYFDGKFEQKMF